MKRLDRYLTGLFAKEALSFFIVAAFLVWITQTLRLFDLVTAKGQDALTLLGQSTLTTPPLALAIIYICMAIGLLRALRALQGSKELHTIHSSGRAKALRTSLLVFIVGGVIAVSLIAHWLEPWSKRAYAAWSEEVAADIVGRALNPHQFSEVVPGLVIVINGRARDGTVLGFFADDTRDKDTRRTYVAERAVIVFDDEGYNLSLENGAIQYIRYGQQFTEVAFNRYELSLNRLTDSAEHVAGLDMQDSLSILQDATDTGLSTAAQKVLSTRVAEASRVIALCLLVAGMAAFPHARRGKERIPAEVLVLLVGLGDRAISSAFGHSGLFAPHVGALLITICALILITANLAGWRLPNFRRPVKKAATL